jgi:hypothetical protein
MALLAERLDRPAKANLLAGQLRAGRRDRHGRLEVAGTIDGWRLRVIRFRSMLGGNEPCTSAPPIPLSKVFGHQCRRVRLDQCCI